MHQSAVRSPRPLVARGCRWSGRQRRPLPFLRRFPPQRPAAARSALAHAAAFARRAPAAAPALKRAPLFLAIASSSVGTGPMLRAARPRPRLSPNTTRGLPPVFVLADLRFRRIAKRMRLLDRYWGPNENFVLVSLWRRFWLLPPGSWLLGVSGAEPLAS
jgi:hypothetical protein